MSGRPSPIAAQRLRDRSEKCCTAQSGSTLGVTGPVRGGGVPDDDLPEVAAELVAQGRTTSESRHSFNRASN